MAVYRSANRAVGVKSHRRTENDYKRMGDLIQPRVNGIPYKIFDKVLCRKLCFHRVQRRIVVRIVLRLPDVSGTPRKQTRVQHLIYGNIYTHRACVPVSQAPDKTPGLRLYNLQGLRRRSLRYSSSDECKILVCLFPVQCILEPGECTFYDDVGDC